MIPDEVREALEYMVSNIPANTFQPGRGVYSTEARVVRAWLDSQPTAPEPDWSQAPQDVQFWAVDGYQDAAGWWHMWWYVNEPVLDQNNLVWDSVDRIYAGEIDLPIGIDWRTTLRQRPKGD